MRRSPDPLFTPAFVALTLSDLAYFTAGGALMMVHTYAFGQGLPQGADRVRVALGAAGGRAVSTA
jgi:hypothetical protein